MELTNLSSVYGTLQDKHVPLRSLGRDVHIYNFNDPATELGGLVLTNGITNANFYSMVETVCIFDRGYFIRDEGGTTIQRDDHPLQPGNYYLLTNGKPPFLHAYIVKLLIPIGSITVNNEPWLVRTISLHTSTRVAVFRDPIRERDRRCVITGRVALNAEYGDWTGFQAAHIFPLAYENLDDNFKIVCFTRDGEALRACISTSNSSPVP